MAGQLLFVLLMSLTPLAAFAQGDERAHPDVLEITPFTDEVDRLVASIHMEKWTRDVAHLASFNRYYRSSDVNRARDWLVEEFRSAGLTTRTDNFDISGYPAFNVIGEILGSERPDEIYIVGAHYDSISEKPMMSAPGAEDNASGTAALIAMAKAIASAKPHATIRFLAFSGEEEGLLGSEHYVDQLIANDEKSKVRGVLIMDMIGFTEDNDLDVLIETSDRNLALVDLLRASTQRYTTGRIETSFSYWGSDHVPFIANNFPAVLLIENDYENYRDYHRSTDLPRNLNVNMATVIIKMAMGVLGSWALS